MENPYADPPPEECLAQLSARRTAYIERLNIHGSSSRTQQLDVLEQTLQDYRIRCQRGPLSGDDSTPLAWHVRELGEIRDIMANWQAEPFQIGDYQAADELCTELPKMLPDEHARATTFTKAVGHALGIHKSDAGNGHFGYHATNGPAGWLILLFKCKNEMGSGGDPVAQVTLDYAGAVHVMHKRDPVPSQYPCLLVALSGTLVTVHVAATIDFVTTEPVFTGFIFQGASCHEITMAAHFIAALRRCIQLVKHYYDHHSTCPPSLPHIDRCTIFGQTDTKIRIYKRYRSRTSVFFAHVDDLNAEHHMRPLVVKFVRRYGTEVHQLLFENGLAPTLHDVLIVPGGWKAVVMDRLGDDEQLPNSMIRKVNDSVKEQLVGEFRRMLHLLQSHGFVHGDLRAPNIVVMDRTFGLKIIDFDWAGSNCSYPHNINWEQFSWLKTPDSNDEEAREATAEDERLNMLIKPADDVAAVQEFLNDYVKPPPNISPLEF